MNTLPNLVESPLRGVEVVIATTVVPCFFTIIIKFL